MKVLTCHNGQLHAAHSECGSEFGEFGVKASERSFVTGFVALDQVAPNGAFARGAVHELLAIPSHPSPFFVALFLAKASMIQPNSLRGAIVWCDPQGKLYPPAVAAMGVPLDRLFLLRPKTIADENWAIAECLRCRGVSATIASPRKLSRIEARRFQLAAERGKGVGILLRPYDRTAHIYAATTRWLVAPQRGLRTVQRWRIELIHGHGGQVGDAVILEHHRETNRIEIHPQVLSGHQAQQLADRPFSQAARATA